MVSLFLWCVLFVGILVWPEMTLAVILFYHGYWVLGIVALLASFYSGKDFVKGKLGGKG